MKSHIDFLMIYPHRDIQAYSQRVLLGILREAGFSVHLLIIPTAGGIKNDSGLRNSFLEMVDKSRIVGFGFMCIGYETVLYLTELIKSNFSKHVIWGGIHPTIKYREMTGKADAIFIGESDITLPKYVDAILNNKPFDHLPQIVTKSGFIPAQKDFFLDDLDRLPVPFYSRDGQTLISDHIENSPEYFRTHFGGLHIMTSRGCPYSCTYCANSFLRNFIPKGAMYIRKRSIAHVICEIQHCRQIYRLTDIAIEDDLFLERKNEDLETFAKEYNREVNLPISITGVTSSYLNEQKARIICTLPTTSIRIGIQTISEKGQALYGREAVNRNMEKTLECVKGLLKKGILVRYDFILDNPYETLADNVKTLRFISHLPKPYGLNLYHLTLYEGTELRMKAIADGLINTEDKNYTSRSYAKLNNNYINTLFRLLRACAGLFPSGAIILLTSPLILNNYWLQKPVKITIDAVIIILEKLSSQKVICGFHHLISGKYNWAWFVRRRGVSIYSNPLLKKELHP